MKTLIAILLLSPVAMAQNIGHGIDVSTKNVGLAGAGVSVDQLTAVPGIGLFRASRLAVDGVIRRLDIQGALYVDSNCTIEQCRIANQGTGGNRYFYGVTNQITGNTVTMRDCDVMCDLGPDGSVCGATINNIDRVERCLLRGGSDGVKFGNNKPSLIDSCYVYGQVITPTSHNDTGQLGFGSGDWHNTRIVRSRLEAPYRGGNSVLMISTDQGPASGITIQDCYLSGGGYAVYTYTKTQNPLTKLWFSGNIWEAGSFNYLPAITSVPIDFWSNNNLAVVTSKSPDGPVVVDSLKPISRPVVK